jgi:signal transduction histidine kinase
MIRLKNTRLLDLSVLLALAMLVTVGLLTGASPAARVGATALCAAFGLVYLLGGRAATGPVVVAAYFAVQTTIALALIGLSRGSDTNNFLLFILAMQAMLTLPTRAGGAVVAAFYALSGALVLLLRGPAGQVTVIFNAVVFLFTAAFGYTLRQTERARQENERLLEELRASQRQVQELAVVEERNRLARDLHDSAKQRAFALSAQLDAVNSLMRRDPAAADVHLQRAIQVADHLRQELANLILQLRPPEMDQGGLAAALRRYAAEWSQQCNVAVDVQVTGERPLPAEVEQTLFRIAQEALANVARHSQAGSAQVLLDYAGERVSLTIGDTGCGFDPAQARSGVGTRSMRERVALLPNGRFRLESRLGQGTQVTAECSA